MNATTKVKLKEISATLACNLCNGYMIDATTAIECLHSYCKSCIVQHLENSEYCPVCEVQLHSTKPLLGLRSDQMLQEIIYKLVPGLFTREMERRRLFYNENPNSLPTSKLDAGLIFQPQYISSDDKISISMEYFTEDKQIQTISRRYLQSPAGVSVFVLRQWVQGKHELPKDAKIEILYGERILPQDFLLMDIAYKYSWTESMAKPLQLRYRIKGPLPPILSVPASLTINTVKPTPSKRKARSLTDSEVLKSSNVNSLSNVTPTPPIKLTPNGKVRGRKKRLSIANEADSMEKVEIKRKKMNKGEKFCSIDMESQCNAPDRSELIAQKEVQLHISESGVISAKSVISGVEKIIVQTESAEKLQKPSLCDIIHPSVTTAQSHEGSLKPQSKMNGVNTNVKANFNYVQLNIPAVNGLHHSPANVSTALPSGKPASNRKIPTPSKLPKYGTSGMPSEKKQMDQTLQKIASAKLDPNFESKKANMQKAIQDLHRQHLNTSVENVTHSQVLGKNVKPTDSKTLVNGEKSSMLSIPSPSINGHSPPQVPLPFPLSALASSGMTVNLIPSSELKQSNNLIKGKDLQSSPPPPSKKLKHHTTLHNGEIRFTTSPRQILPSTSKTNNICMGSSSNDASPTKSRKFFKSRPFSDGENPVKVMEKPASPTKPTNSTASASKQSGTLSNGIGPVGLQGPTIGDLKLINSTSCTKSQTMTTPSSRMAGPTTSSIQSTSQQFSPNVLSQLIQYWNTLQFHLPLGGIPQMNFLPTMTKDYNSMAYLNPRPINDSITSLMPNPTYSTIYTPYSLAPGLGNAVNFNCGDAGTTTPTRTTTEATDLSLTLKSKQKTDSSAASLDLSLKKSKASNGVHVKQNKRNSPSKTKSHIKSDTNEKKPPPDSSITTQSTEIPRNSSISIDPVHQVGTNGNSDSGLDSLSPASESYDKEPEIDLHVHIQSNKVDTAKNTSLTTDNPKSTNTIKPIAMSANSQPLSNKESITANGNFSPGSSNDSTDLVINEDCEEESLPNLETNSNNIEPTTEPKISDEPTITSAGEKHEIVPVNGNCHPTDENNCSENDTTNAIKDSTACNNNNDPPADPGKLTTSTTTGA